MSKNIKIKFMLTFVAMAVYGAYLLYLGKMGIEQSVDVPVKVLEANTPQQNENTVPSKNETNPIIPEAETKTTLSLPLSSALLRVTKKPVGIKVSPGNSPVSPEKFSGYHTGVDFEIFPGEENADIPVSALCSGPIIVRRIVSGYGGVVIQKCNIENVAVTALYGHLKLSSIEKSIGDEISFGEKIGVLGKGYSTETGGERKHLHLGIYRGIDVNYLGYVQSKEELLGWINAMEYLK